MLFINRTVTLIVAWNALGFFAESGYVLPFLVDLFDFCRSFEVDFFSTIKIYIGHYNLINEVNNVIERNSLHEVMTTI